MRTRVGTRALCSPPSGRVRAPPALAAAAVALPDPTPSFRASSVYSSPAHARPASLLTLLVVLLVLLLIGELVGAGRLGLGRLLALRVCKESRRGAQPIRFARPHETCCRPEAFPSCAARHQPSPRRWHAAHTHRCSAPWPRAAHRGEPSSWGQARPSSCGGAPASRPALGAAGGRPGLANDSGGLLRGWRQSRSQRAPRRLGEWQCAAKRKVSARERSGGPKKRQSGKIWRGPSAIGTAAPLKAPCAGLPPPLAQLATSSHTPTTQVGAGRPGAVAAMGIWMPLCRHPHPLSAPQAVFEDERHGRQSFCRGPSCLTGAQARLGWMDGGRRCSIHQRLMRGDPP